jgi:hypothetical protein
VRVDGIGLRRRTCQPLQHRKPVVDDGQGVVELAELGEQRLSSVGQPVAVAGEIALFGCRGA